MSEPVRKTEARVAERDRRRKEREQTQNLRRTLPFILVGLLAVLGVGLIIYGTTQANANISGASGPRLQVDRDLVELGDQHFNTTVRATFRVTNAGDSTLTLNVPKVATAVEGCWPGDVVVGQTTLQPGQSSTIYTELIMHEGMGGKHLFEIPLKTNDPTQQAKTLQIKSNWIP